MPDSVVGASLRVRIFKFATASLRVESAGSQRHAHKTHAACAVFFCYCVPHLAVTVRGKANTRPLVLRMCTLAYTIDSRYLLHLTVPFSSTCSIPPLHPTPLLESLLVPPPLFLPTRDVLAGSCFSLGLCLCSNPHLRFCTSLRLCFSFCRCFRLDLRRYCIIICLHPGLASASVLATACASTSAFASASTLAHAATASSFAFASTLACASASACASCIAAAICS